ncbi:MAG: hypothetical protein QW279_01305 [Candidatus Jordarchaeaceae archaeon]
MDPIIAFFTMRNFKVQFEVKEDSAEFSIRRSKGFVEPIHIFVNRDGENLIISFKTGETSRSLIFLGRILSFLGGGFFAVIGQRMEEELDLLEMDFWSFIKDLIF